MKYRKIIIGILVMGIIVVAGLWINQTYPQTQEVPSAATETRSLKEACINATIRGIELDIGMHQKWLEIPEEELTEGAESREKIKFRLDQLNVELEKYENIRLQNYELPEKREIIGWVNQPCTEDITLQIEDMSRSGPFYHIVGIKGEDYSVIKPQIRYRMTMYLVYPRDYPFTSYYIYIDNYEQMQ